MSDDEHDKSYRERLKSALWFTIGKATDNESLELDVNVTPQFVGAVTEMVFAQIESVTKDVASFAHHANRSTISTDDVLLLARRNAALEEILRNFVAQEKVDRDRENAATKAKGKAITGRKKEA